MVRIIFLLLCGASFSQDSISVRTIKAESVLNKLLECHELEKQYNRQNIIIKSYAHVESELSLSLIYQKSENERLKRVNEYSEQIQNSLYEDLNICQKKYQREKRKSGLFSFQSFGKMAIGIAIGVVGGKILLN